jgi:hypothetical protein
LERLKKVERLERLEKVGKGFGTLVFKRNYNRKKRFKRLKKVEERVGKG